MGHDTQSESERPKFVDDRHIPEDTNYNFVAYAVDTDGEYAYLGLYAQDTPEEVAAVIREMCHTVRVHGADPREYEELDIYAVGKRATYAAPDYEDSME